MSPRARRRPRHRRSRSRRRLGRLAARALLAALALSAGPVLCVRVVDPPTSAVMLQRRIASLGSGAPAVDHVWLPLTQISPALQLAVVAAEDQKFPRHRGFDLEAIGDALDDAEAGGRLRGASTISQQVAKNLFLWPGRSFLRKSLEAWLTVWLEALWPKRRILEVYLNVAELGGPGVFGAEAASRRCFGRPAAALGARDAALLAATLPSPRTLRCDAPTPGLRARAARIEAAAARLRPGWLDGVGR